MAAACSRRETPGAWHPLLAGVTVVATVFLSLLAGAEDREDAPEAVLAGLEARLPDEAAAVMEAVSGLLAQAGLDSADLRAEAYILRGKAYWLLEELEISLGDYLAALALVDPLEDPVRYGRILINAGAVHYRLEAFDEADALFREALRIAEANGVERMRAAAWTNLALLLTEAGEFPQARRKFHWAREFYERRGAFEELARVLHNEGILEREAGDYAAAMERFERAVAIHRSHGDYPEVARSMRHRAETYLRMGLPQAAVLQAEVALEILRGYDLPMLANPIHAVLAQAYAETERWEEALEAERAHGRGRREVLEQRQSATLEQARLRFKGELEAGRKRVQAAETALAQAELSSTRAELARRTWQLTAMTAVGVTLLLVIVGLVLRGRFRARTNRELRDVNARLSEALSRARTMAESASAAVRPLVALIDPGVTSRRILSIYLDQIGAETVEGARMADLERIGSAVRGLPDLCIIDEAAIAGPPGGLAVEMPAGFERVPVILLIRANGTARSPGAGDLTLICKPVRRADLEATVRRLTQSRTAAPQQRPNGGA